MDKIKSFKELRMWQKGIEIIKDVYTLTREFPKEEIYGLTAQMRRSAISIPSNIAERFKRPHPKEYKQFLHIALGSAAELETQLLSFAKVMEHYPFYYIPLTLPSPPTTGERKCIGIFRAACHPLSPERLCRKGENDKNVMLNLFQHLIKSNGYETLKRVQGDKIRITTQSPTTGERINVRGSNVMAIFVPLFT